MMPDLNRIKMPKGCISCNHFVPLGKKFDPMRQKTGRWFEIRASFPHGRCQKSGTRVWGTELCNRFECDELIEIVDVSQSRQNPIEPRQEALF